MCGSASGKRSSEELTHSLIHCPYQSNNMTNFTNIFQNIEFKSYLLQNLDLNPFLISILDNIYAKNEEENEENEEKEEENEEKELLLAGISYFQSLRESRQKQLYKEINEFQRFPLAGIPVSE